MSNNNDSDGWQVLHRQPQAPALPAPGAPCNGCGVCCLLEPCPLGVLVSLRRTGACKALIWESDGRRYRCGMVMAPERFVPLGARLVARLARRWIAAGTGCDASLLVREAGSCEKVLGS